MRRTIAILFLALSFYGQLAAQVSYDANMTNIVKVTYNGTGAASVVIASNLQSYVTVTVNGGAVSVVQQSTVSASTCGEIIYQLTGASTNGSFTMEGNYKATIELHGLSLTNHNGPAVNILNADAEIHVSTITGASLGIYSSLVEACQSLSAGIYVISNGTQSQSIVVK